MRNSLFLLTGKETIIFLSFASEIRGLDFTNPTSSLIHHLSPPIAGSHSGKIPTTNTLSLFSPGQLDFDSERQMVYWSEPQLGEVRRVLLDGRQTVEVILDTGLQVQPCVALLVLYQYAIM